MKIKIFEEDGAYYGELRLPPKMFVKNPDDLDDIEPESIGANRSKIMFFFKTIETFLWEKTKQVNITLKHYELMQIIAGKTKIDIKYLHLDDVEIDYITDEVVITFGVYDLTDWNRKFYTGNF